MFLCYLMIPSLTFRRKIRRTFLSVATNLQVVGSSPTRGASIANTLLLNLAQLRNSDSKENVILVVCFGPGIRLAWGEGVILLA
jgi:hypothetical protein